MLTTLHIQLFYFQGETAKQANMGPLRWGILGAGLITHDFLIGFATLPVDEHKVVAIAARNLERATLMAKTHGITKAYGNYEELVRDSEIGKLMLS